MAEALKIVLTKLSKYEWLNILLPGCFFELLGTRYGVELSATRTTYSVLLSVLFWGMLSSRVGATIIEMCVKRFNPFAPYGLFIDWEKANPDKAKLMVANLNMFRALSGMSLLLMSAILAKQGILMINRLSWMRDLGLRVDGGVFVGLCLFVLFVWSYARQIQFIKERVEKSAQSTSKEIVTQNKDVNRQRQMKGSEQL